LSVSFGRTKAKISIKATIEKSHPGRPRLLIAATPFNRYSTTDGTMFSTWTDLAKEAKADVSYLLAGKEKAVLRDLDLTQFTCVLLADGGLVFLTPEDITKVRRYAQGGGRVVVAANAFMLGTIQKANEVLEGSAGPAHIKLG
jgi:hypothetical protein